MAPFSNLINTILDVLTQLAAVN